MHVVYELHTCTCTLLVIYVRIHVHVHVHNVHESLVHMPNDGNTGTNINARSFCESWIQLGFIPRTLRLLGSHSHYWATRPLVAEECRVDVDILRIQFKHRQWLGSTSKHHSTHKACFTPNLTLTYYTHLHYLVLLCNLCCNAQTNAVRLVQVWTEVKLSSILGSL